MTIKPTPPASVHFPTAGEHGPVPFPTSKSMRERKAAAGELPEVELSAEELRLMADTMPGEGPGD